MQGRLVPEQNNFDLEHANITAKESEDLINPSAFIFLAISSTEGAGVLI